MTIDYVDQFHQQIVDIGSDSADPARTATAAPRTVDVKAAVRPRLYRLTDDTLHRVAIYIAGALVADGVAFAARNVGSEHHTWWGWLLIGVPLIWLSFIGMVALTFAALRVAVGILRRSLSWIAGMSARSRSVAPVCCAALAGVFIDLVGPGAVGPH
jgi:hypothetical protein